MTKRRSTTTEETPDEEATPVGDGPFASEVYPSRRTVDVDVADVDPGDGEGEFTAPLNGESWVVLNGKHKDVPKRFDGAIAAVIDYPTTVEQDPDTGEVISYLPPQAKITVRERSQGATFSLPIEAFKEVHTNGRAGVLGFA